MKTIPEQYEAGKPTASTLGVAASVTIDPPIAPGQEVWMMKCEQFATEMVDEVGRAVAKHQPLNSAHEAYAVILEELDEF